MNDKDKLDLENTEEFIKEYCARTELETKARDAALLLYKKLKQCENETHQEEEKKEEPKKEEEVQEEVEATQEEVDEPVISEEKFKKLQNAKQGKKTYREFLKRQLKTIGMAGIIAMSTAVYTQGQVVYKNGMIVFEVLEREFPFLTTIKNLVTSSEGSNTSQSNSNSNTNSNNTSQAAADVPSSPAANTASNNSAPTPDTNSTQETTQTSESPPETASTEPTTKGGDRDGDNVFSKDSLEMDFGKPIVPPKTTETNPQ